MVSSILMLSFGAKPSCEEAKVPSSHYNQISIVNPHLKSFCFCTSLTGAAGDRSKNSGPDLVTSIHFHTCVTGKGGPLTQSLYPPFQIASVSSAYFDGINRPVSHPRVTIGAGIHPSSNWARRGNTTIPSVSFFTQPGILMRY